MLPGKPASLVPRQRVCGLSSTHRGEGKVDLGSGRCSGILLDCTYQVQFNITTAVSLVGFSFNIPTDVLAKGGICRFWIYFNLTSM